jgi:dTDP-4-dehydrorhamnose reductase
VILITGAAGLLGSNLVLTLLDAGMEVVSAYHSHPLRPSVVRGFSLDLTDEREVRSKFESLPVRCVVHCAAATNVDWCEQHPAEAFRANVVASRCVAEAVRRAGARMIYLSTDSVYCGDTGSHRETEVPDPANVYARTKLEGENVVLHSLGDSALILRVTLYGWNMQHKQSLSEWILTRLERGETVPGFTDVSFSPISATSVARIIAELVQRGTSGIFNVGGGERCSKFDFAVALAGVFGRDVSLIRPSRISESSLMAPRPHDTSLDTSKLAGLLGHSVPTFQEDLLEQKRLYDTGFVERLKSCANGEMHAHA